MALSDADVQKQVSAGLDPERWADAAPGLGELRGGLVGQISPSPGPCLGAVRFEAASGLAGERPAWGRGVARRFGVRGRRALTAQARTSGKGTQAAV